MTKINSVLLSIVSASFLVACGGGSNPDKGGGRR